ncbi:hypothetical protein NPIL_525251 [Nephila pilipes]|uniref:Uncharacterized protein n=1 Tax=Nephila pilipes TaxID=299642 RepID=A0A8X6P8B4_NEPPI|nr:hypothetical protein NPIL_525251 [Nephila pilipes]
MLPHTHTYSRGRISFYRISRIYPLSYGSQYLYATVVESHYDTVLFPGDSQVRQLASDTTANEGDGTSVDLSGVTFETDVVRTNFIQLTT